MPRSLRYFCIFYTLKNTKLNSLSDINDHLYRTIIIFLMNIFRNVISNMDNELGGRGIESLSKSAFLPSC